MDKVARLLGIEKTYLPLRQSVLDSPAQQRIIEKMVKRYSISYVPCRAVVLFDIVGFGLLSPFEQMAQLNSLAYSLNSAQSKLMSKEIGIDFSRSTTGDGFYVWNRSLSLGANVNLYHFMHLVLADNAIARSKARHGTVPRLRAGFHVGGSYEFHQAEGLNPTLYNYIVGDVTIELARMVECAVPGQILVGEFVATMNDVQADVRARVQLDSIDFVFRAAQSVAQLTGIELSGERVDLIKCYLTGVKLDDGEFSVRRLTIDDKHGISRIVYNAKANIYRQTADPILLGVEDKSLKSARAQSEHVQRTAHT
jgi:class 3 adenylate cyclase